MYVGNQDVSSGESTKTDKAISAIFEIMGLISEYPFTQLTDPNPIVVYESLHNPDSELIINRRSVLAMVGF